MALLEAGAALAREQGIAPILTHVSLAEVAEEAGMSRSATLRAVRSHGRLSELVLVAEGHSPSEWPAQNTLVGSVVPAVYNDETAALVQATIDRYLSADLAIPQPVLFCYSTADPRVAVEVQHHTDAFVSVFELLIDTFLRSEGLRPIDGVSFADALLLSRSMVFGVAVLGALMVDDPDELVSWGTPSVERMWEALFEPGALGDHEAARDQDQSVRPAPVSDTEWPVVRAAGCCLHRSGVPLPFDQLSVRRVAREAGLSASSLYGYWADIDHYRSALFEHVVEGAADRVAAALSDADARPRGTPSAVGDALAAWLDDPVMLPMITMARSRPDRPEHQRLRRHLDEVAGVLGRCMTGMGAPVVDGPVEAGRDLLMWATGAALHRFTDGHAWAPGERRDRSVIGLMPDIRYSPSWSYDGPTQRLGGEQG